MRFPPETSAGESMAPAILAASFLALSCGGAAPVEAPAEEGGRVPLVIVDSIGVELGDSNYVIGSIDALEHGPDGDIYLLDRGRACVRVFDREGGFRRRISSEGSGPGELTNPLAMAVLGDGRVAVCDPWRGGIHTFRADGEWEGLAMEFTNNPPMMMQGADSSAFVARKLTVEPDDGEITVSAIVGRYELDRGTEPVAVYYGDEFPFDPNDVTSIVNTLNYSLCTHVDREGTVYAAPYSTEEYRVMILSAEGEELLSFSREMPRAEKTEEEVLEEKEWMEAYLSSMGASGVRLEYDPEPYRWMISDIGVDGMERIWVRRGTEREPVFDVYDMSGEPLFTAELPGAGPDADFWEFVIDEHGMMAWSTNPEYYYKVWLLEVPAGEI